MSEGITIYTNKQMEFIVHLIILLAICYFLYKINFYKADTEKTEKKTNSKDEFDQLYADMHDFDDIKI